MRRIGIFGGTFDPPHIAHLRIAEEAREQMQLDAVFFVPNKQPVHREPAVADAEDRYAMLVLATASNPAFRVSRNELDRPTPSYSVETVREFRKRYPNSELFFIVGADEVADLGSWKDIDALMSMCQFIAAPRGSSVGDSLPPGVIALEMAPLPMSATEIRRRVAEGRSVRYQVPDAVLQYIQNRGLYKGSENS